MLVNGVPEGFFNSSRRLRQGDPLSPLLFVIVMEAFSHMLSVAINGGFLAGFSVNCTNISHLLFAVDTLHFCERIHDHMQYLRVVLLCFEVVSVLKVNLSKSEMALHVGGVNNIQGLANILGYKIASLPLKYLSLPLGAAFKTIYLI